MNADKLRRLVDPEGEEQRERADGQREAAWSRLLAEDAREGISEALYQVGRVWDKAIHDLGRGDTVLGEERLRNEARVYHDFAELVALKEWVDAFKRTRGARLEADQEIRSASARMEREKRKAAGIDDEPEQDAA